MNRDLEATLTELGPGYREMVGRLRQTFEPADDGCPRMGDRSRHTRHRVPMTPYLLAASLLMFLGIVVLMRPRTESAAIRPAPLPPSANEYLVAGRPGAAEIAAILKAQNADGSWKTDYLTRRNMALLTDCASVEARTALKKARRNLRFRGM